MCREIWPMRKLMRVVGYCVFHFDTNTHHIPTSSSLIPHTHTYTTLQMKLSPRRVHLLPLMEPFILPKLRIEHTLLQPSHFERKSRSKLLQSCLGLLLTGICMYLSRTCTLLKDIAMMSNKYKITLIVKRRDLPSNKLGIVREQTSQESTSAMTKTCRKAV